VYVGGFVGIWVILLEWLNSVEWMRVYALFFGLGSERSPYDVSDLVLFHELKRSDQALFPEIDVTLYPLVP
jgi:hypothetical protein